MQIENDSYNNIAINSISFLAALSTEYPTSIAKVFLVLPLVSSKPLLDYMSRANVHVSGFDALLIERFECFSNFSERYYASIPSTINSIQLLHDMKMLNISTDGAILTKNIMYEKNMGKRAEKIFSAAANLKVLLKDSAEKIYLNTRVML